MNALFLTLIEQIVKALELRLVNYEEGGFLPPEKRALKIHSQARLGWLLSQFAQIRFLDHHVMLRNKLLILANVLKNEYPDLSEAYFSPLYKPNRG